MVCGRFEIYFNILMVLVPAYRGLVLLKSGYCGDGGEVAGKNLFFQSSDSFGRLARI